MWIKNFIHQQRFTEEIRKELKELGVKKPYARKDLKNAVMRSMHMFGTIAVRKYDKENQEKVF